MSTIIRFYWVTGDCYNGTDFEVIFPATRKNDAMEYYNNTHSPFKKIVACYDDHDEELAFEKDEEFWSKYEAD